MSTAAKNSQVAMWRSAAFRGDLSAAYSLCETYRPMTVQSLLSLVCGTAKPSPATFDTCADAYALWRAE